MAWNEEALQLLGVDPDCRDGAGAVADCERAIGRDLPAAVAEWFRSGADRRLTQLSHNHIVDLAFIGQPQCARFLEAGLLLLETDSQSCCQWVVSLDGGDDPLVYLISPDDYSGTSREPYADRFTAYTESAVWDALLFSDDGANWSFDHELRPDAIAKLESLLPRRPTTFGWAHNQGCDAVHRFDGPAKVAVAVSGTMALWTVTPTTAALAGRIADILGVPPDVRP